MRLGRLIVVCGALALATARPASAQGRPGPPPAAATPKSLADTLTGDARADYAAGSLIDVGDDKYYGPRRVLVDDTFVYGIDPRVVLRFRKDAPWSAQ